MRIGGRVPFVDVDAVQNAPEGMTPRADDAIEPVAVLGALDLLGVGRTHGGEPIAEADRRLEKAEAIVELEPAGREVVPVETKTGHPVLVEDSLIGEVVQR